MLKRFISYYKPHRKLFALDLLCAALLAACDLFYPMITRSMLNDYIPNSKLRALAIWAVALLLIYIVKAGLKYFMQYYGHMVGVYMQSDMRREAFEHLERLPFGYFDNHKTGAIMSRIINDLQEVSELAHHGPEDVFLSILSIIGALVMICFINPWLSLILLAILPVLLFIAVKLRLGLKHAFKISREKTSEINSAVESSVAGIRVAKAYTAEKHENEKFAAANKGLIDARSVQYKAMSNFNTAMSFAMDFLYLAAFAAGGVFYVKGLISSGDLTSYVLYVAMLITPIRTFVAIFEQIEEGMTGFKRFLEVMDIAPEKEPRHPVKVDRLKGDIVFDNASFRYKKDRDDESSLILNDLSLKIGAGETVALVGHSGGGKTTLCNLIPRFYDIDSGKITIDGIDVRDISLYDLRKNIGSVAQDVFIFGGTVKDNIAYGDFGATDEQIIEAAKLANIHDFIMTLDDGYDTYVGERGVKLSGGQKQRLSIARAFLKNPPILILDEATSALDNVTEMQIQQALERLSVGRTTIVVAHRLSTVKNADEIILLGEGGIEERGTHEELMASGGEYSRLYNYQFRQ